RSLVTRIALLALAIAPAVAAADADYPDTEPGRHARDYFRAYGAGEAAMRAYFESHVSIADLKARPVDARIGIWRQIQATDGALTPIRVVDSGDDHCSVLLRIADGQTVRFDFNCHAEAPHTLMAIMIEPADENVGGGAHASSPAEGMPPAPAPAGPPPSD